MLRYLKKMMYRKLYSLLIYEILFANKSDLGFLSKLKKFAELKFTSNKGDFLFTFKEDRRHHMEYIRRYIVEICVPEEADATMRALDEKVAIMVTVMIVQIDYEILAEVLYERYLDQAILFVDAQTNESTYSQYQQSEIGFW